MMNGKCCQQLDPVSGRGGTSGTDTPIEKVSSQEHQECRRKCGCLKTSDKVKQVLETFPSPPPPTPIYVSMLDKACGYAYGRGTGAGEPKLPAMPCTPKSPSGCCKDARDDVKKWKIVGDLVTLVQLSVTATALALYYLIYCYMQIVYYTLKSAMYFHNADGPMKVTIGVVTATTLIIAFNIVMRMEGLISIVY